MTGVDVSTKVGRIVAGETDIFFRPRGGCGGKRPVFLHHGQMRFASDWTDSLAWPGSSRLAWALARAGLLVIAAYWSGPTWGNATFRAEVETARGIAAGLGAAADKFIPVGASMGSFEALSLGQHVPAEVACGVCTIPAVNLDYFRDNNVANARANINTAYNLVAGSTSSTVPLPADANSFNNANAAQITSPFKLYGSSADATAPWADAVAMAGKMPDAVAIDVSDQGHTDATIKAAPVQEIIDFVLAHAA